MSIGNKPPDSFINHGSFYWANVELSRGPQGHRFELLVLPERSEGKEFDTAQLRIPPERSEGGMAEVSGLSAELLGSARFKLSAAYVLRSQFLSPIPVQRS